MGRYKNQNGVFQPVGLKIRHEIMSLICRDPSARTRIPSIRTLATRFSLSPATVKEEFSKLIKEGFIETKHGSGTWTIPGKINLPSGMERKIVGIIVGDGRELMMDPHFFAIISAFGLNLPADRILIRFITLFSTESEDIAKELLSQHLSGLLWICYNTHPSAKKIAEATEVLWKNAIPSIVFGKYDLKCNSINNDYFQAGLECAKMVAQENRHSIYILPAENDKASIFLKGVRSYASKHPEADLDIHLLEGVGHFPENLEKLLKQGIVPEAIFAIGAFIHPVLKLLEQHHIDIKSQCRLFASGIHLQGEKDFHGWKINFHEDLIGKHAAELMTQFCMSDSAEKFQNELYTLDYSFIK